MQLNSRIQLMALETISTWTTVLFCSLLRCRLVYIEGNPLLFTPRVLKVRNSALIFHWLVIVKTILSQPDFFPYFLITWAVSFNRNFSSSVKFFRKIKTFPGLWFPPPPNDLTRTIENYSKDCVSARMCCKLVSLGEVSLLPAPL